MKRNRDKIIGAIIAIGIIATGCNKSEATNDCRLAIFTPNGFEFVQVIDSDSMIEIRNKSTGAHYYLMRSYYGNYTLCPVIQDENTFKVTKEN